MGQRRIRHALRLLVVGVLLFFGVLLSGALRAEEPHERYGAPVGDFDFYLFSLFAFCERS